MWKRFAIGSILVIAATAAATASSLLLVIDRTAARLRCLPGTECHKIQEDLTPTYGGAPQTLMILGSDRRKGDKKKGLPSRSDTVILVRLDPKAKAVKVINLPRDLKVQIPGHGTDKLNAAYAIGGPRLTLKTVKELTGVEVNHVININFKGFKRAVNQIGCVYIDVDRKYYHSNVGLPPSAQYAEINIPAGYQRLCGQDSLDYVRYRHEDNDLVRGTRQDEFLRQARRQVTVSKLIAQRQRLVNIFVDYTTSDIRGTENLLRVVKLALASAGKPIEQVKLTTQIAPIDPKTKQSFVTTRDAAVKAAVVRFLNPGGPPNAAATAVGQQTAKKQNRKRKRKKSKATAQLGLINVAAAGARQAGIARTKVSFPVMYPTRILGNSQFYSGPRIYTIRRGDKRYRAVKMVLKTSDYQWYGLMQTTWRDPPLLKDNYETRRLGGRTFRVYYEGGRVRLVALVTNKAAYWVSNALGNTISERQMLDIAKSLKVAGS